MLGIIVKKGNIGETLLESLDNFSYTASIWWLIDIMYSLIFLFHLLCFALSDIHISLPL